MNNKTLAGILCGLSAASIWGGMYVVSKVVLDVIPPFTLLAIRLALGFLALGTAILIRQCRTNTKTTLSKAEAWRSLLVGVLGYGISLGLQFSGTKLSTASNGALITSTTPVFVLLFAVLILQETISARRVIALFISAAGVLAVIDPRTAEFSPVQFSGNLLLFAAGLTWALYSVLVRKVAQNIDLLTSSSVMLLGGLPSSILLGIAEITSPGLGEITPGIIGGILFLGIVATAIAMFLWNYAFAVLPATVASLTFFAQPVVGTFLGWFFLREKITPLFLLGGVLIGIGILISAKQEQ